MAVFAEVVFAVAVQAEVVLAEAVFVKVCEACASNTAAGGEDKFTSISGISK